MKPLAERFWEKVVMSTNPDECWGMAAIRQGYLQWEDVPGL